MQPRPPHAVIVGLLSLALCAGCKEGPADSQVDAEVASTLINKVTNTSATARWIARNKDVDRANRYVAAALVTTPAKVTEDGAASCAGALIAPRLVLIPARCVCMSMNAQAVAPEGATQLDASSCAPQGSVFLVTYESPSPVQPLRSVRTEYAGDIRPHPDFKMTLSGRGEAIMSNADLAVVVLTAAAQGVPPLRMAETLG